MTELVVFDYPDDDTRTYCERKVVSIRQARRAMLHSAISIGQDLIDVKNVLGHGLFQPWLGAHFGYSMSTAANYMTAARAVDEYPTCWQFDPRVLYLFTKQLPGEVKEAIVEAEPRSYEDAVLIIQAYRIAEWRAAVEEAIPEDPGAALHAIEEALNDPYLHDEALELHEEYVDEFAILSDREPWEIKVELSDRPQGAREGRGVRPPALTLAHGMGNHRLLAWVEGIGKEIAVFPRQDDPVLRAWQNSVLSTLREHLNVREDVL